MEVENRNVVTDCEQEYLINWTNENHNLFTFNSNASGCNCHIEKILDLPGDNIKNKKAYEIIKNIRERIVEKENLHKYKPCTGLPDLIYHMEPGTKFHLHNDSGFKTCSDGIQIRFNVCIKKPQEGGRPIYAGKLLELVECEYIICRAEIDYHTSEWIGGSDPKISLSLGFIIDNADIKLFSNREKVIEESKTFNNCVKHYGIKNLNINEIISAEKNIEYNKKYLLDVDNINDIFTKFIYEKSVHVLKENFINFNSNIYRIEFEICKNKKPKFSIEYNRENKNYPITTIITYLNNSDSCLILTDIILETYKYKELPTKNIIEISVPSENTVVSFDSSKYYGFVNLNENESSSSDFTERSSVSSMEDLGFAKESLRDSRLSSFGAPTTPLRGSAKPSEYIKVNIWDVDINNVSIYKSDIIIDKADVSEVALPEQVKSRENEIEFKNIDTNGNDSLINDNIIEELLYGNYEKNSTLKKKIDDIVKNNKDVSLIRIECNFKEHLSFDLLAKKYGELANDIYPLLNNNKLTKTNRFYNNKIVTNVLSKDVCYWIINECEKFNNWGVSPYNIYDNYLSIQKMPSVSNFIHFMANLYLMQLKKMYDINDNVNLFITDIFMTKYSNKKSINHKKMADSATFIINIQINDTVDFKGGEIEFISNNSESELTVEEDKVLLKQGDMLIYSSSRRRSNGGVTDGEKYVLVFLINIRE